MCRQEGVNLQRGMYFRLGGNHTVVLMSVRRGAPYHDAVKNKGTVLIYEGHDIRRTPGEPSPKAADQPEFTRSGSPTQNRLFWEAAQSFKSGQGKAELAKVYEKIKPGIWVYNGLFRIVDAWREKSGHREVFKFKLVLTAETTSSKGPRTDLEHLRLIPSRVKIEVWTRDKGRCVKCGATDHLHFDHIIPFSKGGTSLSPQNIQILCARHNLSKSDRIE
jgi:HNH endonuclease